MEVQEVGSALPVVNTQRKTLLTLAEAARKLGTSEQGVLTLAADGQIDLCVQIPPRHRVYSVSRVHVGLPDHRPFRAMLYPDLVVPVSYPAVDAVLLTKATCEMLMSGCDVAQDFAPAALERATGGERRVIYLRDLQAIPGSEERFRSFPQADVSSLSAWNTTEGVMPPSAAMRGMHELSFHNATQGVAFSIDELASQKPEPWSVIDGRGRRQGYRYPQWFAVYPEGKSPGIDSFTGIDQPASIPATAQTVRVSADEVDRILTQKALAALHRRDYMAPATFGGQVNVSSRLKALDEAAVAIFGHTRPTDDEFIAPAQVAKILEEKYGIPGYMAKSAAAIILPDYADASLPVYMRVMLGRTYRSMKWEALVQGYEEFWQDAGDVTKPENCKSKAEIKAWFQEVHRFGEDMADDAAVIIRPDNAAKAKGDGYEKPKKK